MTAAMPEENDNRFHAANEADQRYRTLFETMAQGVVWQDADGRITSANGSAQRILGLTLAQMQGMTRIDSTRLPIRADGTEFEDQDRPSVEALRTGKPVLGVLLGFIHPHWNEIRWLKIDAIPEIDPQTGTPLGVYSVLEDVTDRRRAEQDVAEASRTVATILENVTDAFFALDREFRYTYVNRRGAEILRRTSDELIGNRIWDILPDLVGTAFDEQFHLVMAGASPVTVEAFYEAAQAWYRAHAYSTPDGLAFYLRNVTSEREAERERRSVERRQRDFMRDVLASVTGGKLHLCFSDLDLPGAPPRAERIMLTRQEGLRSLRGAAEEAARAAGFADDRCYDLITAASEAGMNAIVHAGGGEASVGVLPEKIVQVRVIDEGAGISVENLPRATLEKGYTTAGTMGHGMKMILRSTDRVYLRTSPTGTTVVLEQGSHPVPAPMLSEW